METDEGKSKPVVVKQEQDSSVNVHPVGVDPSNYVACQISNQDEDNDTKPELERLELAMSLTAEDAEPFALVPKLEPGEDSDSNVNADESLDFDQNEFDNDPENKEDRPLPIAKRRRGRPPTKRKGTVQESASPLEKIACLICTQNSKPWLKKFSSQRYHSAAFLCKAIGLPAGFFGKKLESVDYCSVCQNQLVELVRLYEDFQRIEIRISEISADLKRQLSTKLSEESARVKLGRKQTKVSELRKEVAQKLELLDSSRGVNGSNGTFQKRYKPNLEETKLPLTSLDEYESDNSDLDFSVPSPPESFKSYESVEDDDSDYEPKGGRCVMRASRRRNTPDKLGNAISVIEMERLLEETEKAPSRRRSKSNSGNMKSSNTECSTSSRKNGVPCPQCDRVLSSELKQLVHIRKVHEGNVSPHICDQPNCTKSYKTNKELRRHQLSHTGETPYICELCGKGFKVKQQLQCHQKYKHFPEQHKKHKCPFQDCKMSFITINALKNHEIVHTKAYPVICEMCGKGFVSAYHHARHLKMKHLGQKPFKCDVENCGKTFCDRSSLCEHSYTHTGEWPLFCPDCGAGKSSQSRLKYHIKRHHSKSVVYSCSECPKTYYLLESFKMHQMSHTGIRPFSCEHCPKQFKSSSKLKRHTQIHTGDRPYQCPTCHKCFYTQEFLNTHMEYHQKAIEQGKRTINEARISRKEGPGVSGARRRQSLKTRKPPEPDPHLNVSTGSSGSEHINLTSQASRSHVQVPMASHNEKFVVGSSSSNTDSLLTGGNGNIFPLNATPTAISRSEQQQPLYLGHTVGTTPGEMFYSGQSSYHMLR